ncbi:DUF2845 domain-containing protein [Desulfuromonas sp. DDH964]|uniref:DUF2845 domain-containing protein n=1 Tax=Desulfuromonas sp. DDH964 TaxID=1823759 RepID=UPI00082CB5BF|nr:DUF2845 domain-containing protein [Desulfuromonas sp. DDH964]
MTGRHFWLLLAAILIFMAGPAWALRCGDDLILPGDRRIQVLASCGEPASRERWEEVRAGSDWRYGRYWGTRVKVEVEEWTYNFGPSRFLSFVRLENGVVVRVENGDYGF